jgi:hypothetical protein
MASPTTGFVISAFVKTRAQLKGPRSTGKVNLKWHNVDVTQLRKMG